MCPATRPLWRGTSGCWPNWGTACRRGEPWTCSPIPAMSKPLRCLPPSKTADMGQNSSHSLDDLLYLMACLRDATHGCPWDRQQDFASIAPHTLEEVYEVIDAIERAD